MDDLAPDPARERIELALEVVRSIELAEDALPTRRLLRTFLLRDRVARRRSVDTATNHLVPAALRGAWPRGTPGLRTAKARVAATVVVVAKLDLGTMVKARAAYPKRGVTLAVQPVGPTGVCGVTRAVRAMEVVGTHAPELAPRTVAHGGTADGLRYLVEEWAPGVPVPNSVVLNEVAPQLLAGLRHLQDGYGVRPVNVHKRWQRWLSRWQQVQETGLLEEPTWHAVHDLLQTNRNVHISWGHGDLVASNVLRSGDRVTLIDWEHSDEASVMHDAAKLHLFCSDPEATLTHILDVLDRPTTDEDYRPAEELALAHAQLLSHYPARRRRLAGHARAEIYERQVRRQADRLALVLARI